MLTQLVYTSKAKENLTTPDIYSILTKSVEENSRYGITGFLLYNDGKFRQVIEGDNERIDQLYKNICNDPRHTVTDKNLHIPIKERIFPLWAMGFCPSRNEQDKFQKFEKNFNVFPTNMFDEVNDTGNAIQLLKDFIKD